MSRIDKTATKFRPIARPKGPAVSRVTGSPAGPGIRLGVGSGYGVTAGRAPSVAPPSNTAATSQHTQQTHHTQQTQQKQQTHQTQGLQSNGDAALQLHGVSSAEGPSTDVEQPSQLLGIHDRRDNLAPEIVGRLIGREGEEDIPRQGYGTVTSQVGSNPISIPSAPAPSWIIPPPSVLPPLKASTVTPVPPLPPPPPPSSSIAAIPLSGPAPPQPRARVPPSPNLLSAAPSAPIPRARTREPTATPHRGNEAGPSTGADRFSSPVSLNPEQPGRPFPRDQSLAAWRPPASGEIGMEGGELPSVFGNVAPPPPEIKKGRGRKKKEVGADDGAAGEVEQVVKKKRPPPKKKVPPSRDGSETPPTQAGVQGVEAGPSQPKRPRGRPKKVIAPVEPKKKRVEDGEEDIGTDDSDLGDFDPEGDGSDSHRRRGVGTGTSVKRVKTPRNPNRIIGNDAINDDSILPGQALGPAIDSSALTMAEVAANPGKGRVSRRGLELEKRKKEEMRKRKEKGREGRDGEGREGSAGTEVGTEVDSRASRPIERDFFSGVPPMESTATSVPQVREVNGELVLVQESTIIDHHARTMRNAENMETIEENDVDRFVNSASYQKKTKGPKWSEDETQLFLEKISEFGTDFQMIAYCFPGRNRSMIRRKYNTEMRLREERLDEAWSTRKEVDLDYVAKTMKINFNEPLESLEIDEGEEGGVGDEETRASSPATTGKEGSPSRSSRAGSASTGAGVGIGVGARGRQMMKKKAKKRSRSQMEEGVEIVGDVIAKR